MNESDEAVARRVGAGDRDAFATLVQRHRDHINRLARRLCRSPADAEDVTQDTFLLAYRWIASFRGDAKFAAWLHQIGANAARMHRRADRRRPTRPLEDRHGGGEGSPPAAESPWPPADHAIDRKRISAAMNAALERLDGPHRAVFLLREVDGLSSAEAAALLGTSPGAIRQRLHRARVLLRAHLAHLRGDAQPADR